MNLGLNSYSVVIFDVHSVFVWLENVGLMIVERIITNSDALICAGRIPVANLGTS